MKIGFMGLGQMGKLIDPLLHDILCELAEILPLP